MNPMTGEPNQSNHPSVFTFDPYPPSYQVNWNQSNPFGGDPRFSAPEATGTFLTFATSPPTQQVLPQSDGMQQSQAGLFQVSEPQSTFLFGNSKPSQDVVQFPFQINPAFGQRNFGFKRKTDSPPLQPCKQHITEEKMAEHMSKLHISSETASSKETESGRIQRLYMCEEMRKLQSDSIIPQSLLVKLEQPCKALVLWQPPTSLVPPVVNNDDENENNNGESVPDSNLRQNVMESEMENDVVLNNMDMDNC